MSDETKVARFVMPDWKGMTFNPHLQTLIDSGKERRKRANEARWEVLRFLFNFSSLGFSGRISAAQV
jgi:hypothetical protein